MIEHYTFHHNRVSRFSQKPGVQYALMSVTTLLTRLSEAIKIHYNEQLEWPCIICSQETLAQI